MKKKILLIFLVFAVTGCASMETPQGDPVKVYIAWEARLDPGMRWRESHDRNAVTKFLAKVLARSFDDRNVKFQWIKPGANVKPGPAVYILHTTISNYSASEGNTEFTISYELLKDEQSVLKGSETGMGSAGVRSWKVDTEAIANKITDDVVEKIAAIHSIHLE